MLRLSGLLEGLADPLAFLPDAGRPPTPHPTVGAVGFFGWGNYGDELFFETFRQRLGGATSLVDLIGASAAHDRRSLRRRVLETDVVLIGGGDIVVPWLRTRYWRKAFLRRPVFVAGVGVPTWRQPTAEGTETLRAFLTHPNVRSIGARDEPSAAWIRTALAPSAPVRVSPDLVCGLDLPPVDRPTDPPIFGVAVRRRETPDDLRQVRRLCEKALALGYRLRRLVLATGPTRRDDAEATTALGFEESELISTDDVDAISRAIGECSVLATMKFHGVVVATMYGVPTLALMPTAKTKHFLADIGRSDLLTQFAANDLPDRLTANMGPIDPAVSARLRRDALAYFDALRAEILSTAADGFGRAARRAAG